jgi:uncharacterized protein DUF6082
MRSDPVQSRRFVVHQPKIFISLRGLGEVGSNPTQTAMRSWERADRSVDCCTSVLYCSSSGNKQVGLPSEIGSQPAFLRKEPHLMARRRRFTYGPVTVGAMILSVASVVAFLWASPRFLKSMSRQGFDWETLSFIGQSYGAIAAVFSGLAFLGVVVALTIQIRQGAVQQVVSLRQQHMEVLKITLENPEYERWLYGDEWVPPIYAYVNLGLQNIYLFWRVGEIDDEEAQWDLNDFFSPSPYARSWWVEKAREAWTSRSSSKVRTQFREDGGCSLRTPSTVFPHFRRSTRAEVSRARRCGLSKIAESRRTRC